MTQDLHYENFRSERLKRGGRSLPKLCRPLCSLAQLSWPPASPFGVLPRAISTYLLLV